MPARCLRCGAGSEWIEGRAAPGEGGWISAADRLPEPGQRVVYYFDVVGAHVGKMESGTCQADAVFVSRLGFLTGDVTHWMPLEYPKT